MSDSHSHHHHHEQSQRNLAMAFFLNLGFTVIELIGGWWTNSVAILSDAVHDLGDSLSLGVAWFLQRRAQQGKDAAYSFGYRRFSLLGALINGTVLILGSILVIQEALPRLWTPSAAHAPGMMLLALGGILINGLAFWRLQGGDSLNEKTVRLHLFEDVAGWVAVLVGGGVIYITGWKWIDPLLSLGIATWVLINAVRNLRGVLRILLQAVPSGRDLTQLQTRLLSIEGVDQVHDLHLWSLDGSYEILTLHLVTEQAHSIQELATLKRHIRQSLSQLGIQHATIETEHPDESCTLVDSPI
jgi:cobalt-zinc-cadmium efflux system protein